MKRLVIGLMLIPSISFAACPIPDGSSPSCPLNVTPVGGSGSAVAQTAFNSTSITTANTYQQLAAAGACTHGGYVENLSTASSTAMEYFNFTGNANAGGTTLANGSIPIGGSQSTNQPGGGLMIPPTTNAVYVYGPAGATYQGYCS